MERRAIYEGAIPARFRQTVFVVMIDHGDDGHDVSDQVEPGIEYRIGDVLSLQRSDLDAPTTLFVRRTDRREAIGDDGTFSREWIVYVSSVAVV